MAEDADTPPPLRLPALVEVENIIRALAAVFRGIHKPLLAPELDSDALDEAIVEVTRVMLDHGLAETIPQANPDERIGMRLTQRGAAIIDMVEHEEAANREELESYLLEKKAARAVAAEAAEAGPRH